MATLDYSSVENWVKLGAIMVRWFDPIKDSLDLDNESDQYTVHRKLAQEARDMGFNLKQGNRIYGARSVLAQLDERLLEYWRKHYDTRHPNYHDTGWLDVPKRKK